MKKLFVVLIAAMLVAGFAGKAAASYFNDGDLIRVVFDTASHVEVATDLGSVSSILAGGSLSADSFKANFTTGGTTDWANMQVAYFSFSPSTGPRDRLRFRQLHHALAVWRPQMGWGLRRMADHAGRWGI